MTRSLNSRLNRIAASIPEPAPEPERGADWHDDAPPSVRRYYDRLAQEFAADDLYAVDRAAAWAAHKRRHPAFIAVAQAVVEALVSGYDVLPCAQAAMLRDGYHKLGWAVSRERAKPGHGATNESQDWAEAARRMTGDDHATYGAFWADRAGAAWAEAWRDRGTRDPATLEAMQFGDAELELLAAQDDPRRDERNDDGV
jgi:hypothetical protein